MNTATLKKTKTQEIVDALYSLFSLQTKEVQKALKEKIARADEEDDTVMTEEEYAKMVDDSFAGGLSDWVKEPGESGEDFFKRVL